MTAPLEVTESSSTAQPEAALQGMSRKAIQGRSLGQIAWLRLERDKVAMTAGIVVLALIMVAVFAPLIVKLLGYPPDEFHQDEIDISSQLPINGWGGISWKHLFGLEPGNGRDLFSRVVYGAQISLLI